MDMFRLIFLEPPHHADRAVRAIEAARAKLR